MGVPMRSAWLRPLRKRRARCPAHEPKLKNRQHKQETIIAHEFPDLPCASNTLVPHISAETLEYHYGKHHAAYVNYGLGRTRLVH